MIKPGAKTPEQLADLVHRKTRKEIQIPPAKGETWPLVCCPSPKRRSSTTSWVAPADAGMAREQTQSLPSFFSPDKTESASERSPTILPNGSSAKKLVLRARPRPQPTRKPAFSAPISSAAHAAAARPLEIRLRPCGECVQCTRALKGSWVDFTEIRPENAEEGSTGSLKIDQFRKLKETLGFGAHEGGYRIFLIPDADRMTLRRQTPFSKFSRSRRAAGFSS